MARVPARELVVGDVIRPPEREMRLWMRRSAVEKGLTDDALWMTIEDIRQGARDKRGEWLIVTARPVPAWGDTHVWKIKMRPETPWPRMAKRNPITHRTALRYAKQLAAHERASFKRKNPPTKAAQRFIGTKIRRLAREGMAAPRRVAAAYSMARRAGFRSVPKRARKNPYAISETRNLRAAMTELEWCMDRTRGEVNRKINSVHQVLSMLYDQAAQGIHQNPTLAVLGNPPAKVVATLSRRLYELRYRHAADGKDYRHPFGPGATVSLLAGGSVWIHARHKLWEEL